MSWVDGEAPEGWKLRPLGEVAKVVGGGTPKTSVPGNFADEPGHPWITPADLTGNAEKYISRGSRFLTDQGLATSSARYMPGGTVLFSSRAPIGYVAIAANPVTTNQGFRSFIPSEVIDSEYLYHVLSFLKPLAEQLASGTTFPELSGSNAGRLPIAYPSFDEQRAIARALDCADEYGRSASAHLSAGKRAIERFRQAVFTAACSGLLTSDWRDRHLDLGSSEEFLHELPALRRRVLGTAQRAPSDPAEDVPFEVPTGWVATSLERVSARITSGSRDWSRFYGRGSGTFVMAQNVRCGYLDWSFRQAVDPPEDDPSRERSHIRRGDLLITIVGANTGDVGPVTEDRPEHYVCQSVALVRPIDSSLALFLNLWFNSPTHGRAYFQECIYGAGRPHLSFEQLKASPIALPTLPEQAEIVRRVDRLLDMAHDIGQRIEAANAVLERSSHAILAKAFRGELVDAATASKDA